MARQLGAYGRLTVIDRDLLRSGVVGGLLGGSALFLVMGGYYASEGMGFASMLNACFAGFVYPDAGMAAAMPGHGPVHAESMSHGIGGGTTMAHAGGSMAPSHAMGMAHHSMMMASPVVSSHLAVGSALHAGMSAIAGAGLAIVLGLLIRLGFRPLASPLGYVFGGLAGGALLFVVMVYGVAPALNTAIADFTPRVPFFFAHLVFGAVAAGFVYWRRERVAVTKPASVAGSLDASPAS